MTKCSICQKEVDETKEDLITVTYGPAEKLVFTGHGLCMLNNRDYIVENLQG